MDRLRPALRPAQLAGCLDWLGRLRLASLQLHIDGVPHVTDMALKELGTTMVHAPPSVRGALRELVIVPYWPEDHALREDEAAALAPFTRLERLTLRHFGSVPLPSLPLSIWELTLVLPDPNDIVGGEMLIFSGLHFPAGTQGVSWWHLRLAGSCLQRDRRSALAVHSSHPPSCNRGTLPPCHPPQLPCPHLQRLTIKELPARYDRYVGTMYHGRHTFFPAAPSLPVLNRCWWMLAR